MVRVLLLLTVVVVVVVIMECALQLTVLACGVRAAMCCTAAARGVRGVCCVRRAFDLLTDAGSGVVMRVRSLPLFALVVLGVWA